MKKQILKAIAFISEKSIKIANNSTCYGWTYQPIAPENIKKYKK